MSNTVALRNNNNALAPLSTEQLELIKRTVAKDATNDELELFLYDCRRRNIHPLDKLLHFTKRGGRYVPVTSIDLFRSRAAETGELAGSDDAVFEQGNSKFPVAATVTVYRLTQGQRFSYTATARWSEYCPGSQNQMWQKMPHTMLAKCAEALALRKAFPQELGGLYTKEEMDQSGADVESAPARTPPAPAPVQLAKPEPAHDPQTGEILEGDGLDIPASLDRRPKNLPHPIAVPITADDKKNWIEFGQQFIAAVRACKSLAEANDWYTVNQSTLDQMRQVAPKAYKSVETAKAKAMAALATPADLNIDGDIMMAG